MILIRPVVARATNITNISSLKLDSNHSWIFTKNPIELSYIFLHGKPTSDWIERYIIEL